MFDIDIKGIEVVATSEMLHREYKDKNKGTRIHYERDVKVNVFFWRFKICNGDFYGLAFVKSTLQDFIQFYSRRSNKAGSHIELKEELCREVEPYGKQSLSFVARQKAKEHYLHVSFQSGGKTIDDVYLNIRDVKMLDIALGKAISVLTP